MSNVIPFKRKSSTVPNQSECVGGSLPTLYISNGILMGYSEEAKRHVAISNPFRS